MFTCKYSYLAFSYNDGEIEKLPNLLEYIGFIYFYPASIIGPTYNFIHYQNFIHLKGQYANLPSPLKATFKEFLFGLFFTTLTCLLGNRFPLDDLTTEEYGQRNFLMKIVYLHIYTFVFRFRYYSGNLSIKIKIIKRIYWENSLEIDSSWDKCFRYQFFWF